MDIEQLIEYYAVFGGLERYITLNFSDSLFDSIYSNILINFNFLKNKILPPISLTNENRKMLYAVAMSDGKTINVFKRARLSRAKGIAAYQILNQTGVLEKQISQEPPLIIPSRQKKKKLQRRYTTEAKIEFTYPIYRFWYTFVEPHLKEIEQENYDLFFKSLQTSFDRYVSFTFEELSNALIKQIFEKRDPVLKKGAYWDTYNEFDLFAKTKNNRIIIGECKWKRSKVCKSIVSKLKSKCEKSGLTPDYFAIFSKSGFSKELKNLNDPTLLCFELKDFEKLLRT